MASRYIYSQVISNSYLNVSKEIKANSKRELEMKRNEQLARWNEQETAKRDKEKIQAQKEREKQAIQDLKERSEYMDKNAKDEINDYNSILTNSLKNYIINWNKLKKKEVYTEFSFEVNLSIDDIFKRLKVPKRSFLESFSKSKMEKRINMEKQAYEQYNKEKILYDERRKEKFDLWEKEKETFEKELNEYNSEVDKWKLNFEQGEADAIEKYMEEILALSVYPDTFSTDYTVNYDKLSRILIVSRYVPSTNEVPNIVGYKYIASNKSIKEIYMKEKEQNSFYDNIIKQSALRTIYEIISSDYARNIQSVVFNGWVNGINKATGKDFTSCIISIQASRESIENINFDRIDISECIRSLKGVYAGNLSLLAPIKPIMDIEREDKRFIESREILDGIDSFDNLATMPWEDFEHLVRELFTKYFSGDGAEVKVTQSSRDGGVDAIAFDSDPIRGGKYVIQAKRYNRVVPVSAVRDLYGTMINEGAVKGLLVTTSYYGNDSREFVKDKPISLIDGSNLIHMFSEYGYDLKIELQN